MSDVQTKISATEYELTLLLKDTNILPVKNILEKHNCALKEEKLSEETQLAYPISKQSRAHLAILRFQTEPESVVLILTDLKLVDNILRYFIGRFYPESGKINLVRPVRLSLKERSDRRLSRDVASKSTESILTNEALQEKIEEILK